MVRTLHSHYAQCTLETSVWMLKGKYHLIIISHPASEPGSSAPFPLCKQICECWVFNIPHFNWMSASSKYLKCTPSYSCWNFQCEQMTPKYKYHYTTYIYIYIRPRSLITWTSVAAFKEFTKFKQHNCLENNEKAVISKINIFILFCLFVQIHLIWKYTVYKHLMSTRVILRVRFSLKWVFKVLK